MNIRKASVAGSFYDSSESGLLKQVEDSFLKKFGPKKLPEIKDGPNSLIGVIVPHAGIIYSGSISAHSYLSIADDGFADAFIIIGPNHRGIGSDVAIYPEGKWETPLGTVNIDSELVSKFSKRNIEINEESHPTGENSIEVQIPFLQFINKKNNFSLALISMASQDFQTANFLGQIIADVIKNEKRRIIIIASSDFSHEGGPYGRIPPNGLSSDEFARKQDKLAIKEIENLNPEGLISTVYNKNISMCGYGPIASLLVAGKILGATNAELLKYITSNDIHPSSFCVGYGSFKLY